MELLKFHSILASSLDLEYKSNATGAMKKDQAQQSIRYGHYFHRERLGFLCTPL